jgi:hypothetical protein
VPTSIPYDPTITLGNIVPADHMQTLLNIANDLQAPIDAAQDKLNELILLRRSLGMTAQELGNLNIATDKVQQEMDKVDDQIKTAAEAYGDVYLQNIGKITEARGKIPKMGAEVESPIDFVRSQLKQLPLASDSLKMDAQYFSFDEVQQSSKDVMASMKSYISAATSFMGAKRSAEITTSAMSQVNQQRESHEIQGTLVITANVTHRMASVWAPFYIDVDKGLRAWNEMFPSDQVDMNDSASMINIEKTAAAGKEKSFNLVSGANFGSSFVGMVHVLKRSSTASSQSLFSAAASLQAQMTVGSWFASASGGFGVNSSFSANVKNLLSQQDIQSHVSLVCMGIIPTIVAHNVDIVVKEFGNFSPDATMGQLAALQNATASDQESVAQAATAARTGQQMVSLKTAQMKAAVSAVQEGDKEQNQMLDINSLMTAFTDFVAKAIKGDCGVPINYYLKPITKKQLAEMWISKYLPHEYVTSAGDDSKPNEPGGGGGGGGGGDGGGGGTDA